MELISGFISFLLFTITSHPKSRVNKKLPDKKIKNIQIFPRISILAKNRVIHFHHWVLFTPLYIFINNIEKSISHIDIINGFLLGGIIQGLLFADRFRFVRRRNDIDQVKQSSYRIPLINRFM